MPRCPNNYEHYDFSNLGEPSRTLRCSEIFYYKFESRYSFDPFLDAFLNNFPNKIQREWDKIKEEQEREARKIEKMYEENERESILPPDDFDETPKRRNEQMLFNKQMLFSTRSNDLWQTEDKRGNPIFGFKGDLSHAHTDDVDDPSWISVRTEDYRFKKRYGRGDLYGDPEDF